MKATDLTQEQQEKFAEVFYSHAPSELDDLDCSDPWGCPWDWSPQAEMQGNSIEEMALNFWLENQEEIEELLLEQEELMKDLAEEKGE